MELTVSPYQIHRAEVTSANTQKPPYTWLKALPPVPFDMGVECAEATTSLQMGEAAIVANKLRVHGHAVGSRFVSVCALLLASNDSAKNWQTQHSVVVHGDGLGRHMR